MFCAHIETQYDHEIFDQIEIKISDNSIHSKREDDKKLRKENTVFCSNKRPRSNKRSPPPPPRLSAHPLAITLKDYIEERLKRSNIDSPWSTIFQKNYLAVTKIWKNAKRFGRLAVIRNLLGRLDPIRHTFHHQVVPLITILLPISAPPFRWNLN